MPKVKWGGESLASALDEYEEDESRQYKTYDGPKPPKGVYNWKITRMEKTESSGGFPQLIVHLELDPRHAEQKKYAGYYMRDYIIVKTDGSTAFRVKPLLEALGVSGKQFVTATVVDAEGHVQKIGPVTIPGRVVGGNIWPQKDKPEYFNIKYLPAKLADEKDDSEDDDADDTDDMPF